MNIWYTWRSYSSLRISVREHRKRRPAPKFPAAEESLGGRKEPDTQGKAPSGAPQWKGGGVVFAPVPRDYSFKMNRKEKQAAIRSALTSRVQGNKLIVLDELKLNEIKTKDMKKVLDSLKVNKALVVTGNIDQNVIISARNLPNVRTSYIAIEREGDERKVNSTISVYDIMKYDTVVLTKEAVANIEEVYA